jgi:chaperonin GroEL (HSP60 family)
MSAQGTVLIRSAEELEGYSRSEEDRLEALIKGIADSGARVVVAGSAIGDMALHFIEKYGMMAVRIPSKFDLRRFCRCAKALRPLDVIALHCGFSHILDLVVSMPLLQLCDGVMV